VTRLFGYALQWEEKYSFLNSSEVEDVFLKKMRSLDGTFLPNIYALVTLICAAPRLRMADRSGHVFITNFSVKNLPYGREIMCCCQNKV
jgi:hypothetical protein